MSRLKHQGRRFNQCESGARPLTRHAVARCYPLGSYGKIPPIAQKARAEGAGLWQLNLVHLFKWFGVMLPPSDSRKLSPRPVVSPNVTPTVAAAPQVKEATPEEAPPEVVLPQTPPPAAEAPPTVTAPVPRPTPDVDAERAAEISAYAEDIRDSKGDGFLWWDGSPNADDRYVDAMKGQTSLGDLTKDEQQLLSQKMSEQWLQDNRGDFYFEAMHGLDEGQREILREAGVHTVAQDQLERANNGEAVKLGGEDLSTTFDFSQTVLSDAIYNDPEGLVDAFAGQGSRLGIMTSVGFDPMARHSFLEAIGGGKTDPTTSSDAVNAMYLSLPNHGRETDDFAAAFAATRRPGDSDTDRLARESLEKAYSAFISADNASDEKVPLELQMALLDQIETNPKWTADALKDGWESDVVGKWLASSSVEAYAGRGTDPQTLGGEALRNTIGQSLGIPPDNLPGDDATDVQMQAIYDQGMDYAYYGEGNEALDKVADQIKTVAGSDNAQVTVIPVTVTNNGEGGMTLPVYRVETQDGPKFVDHTGRSYKDLADWEENNVLPSGRMTYPSGMDMANKDDLVTRNTPEVNDSWQEHALAIGDGVATVAGIAALGLFVVGTGGVGGAILMGGAAGAGLWTMGRAGASLADDANHGVDITDMSNPSVRSKWIEAVAGGLSAGAGGFGVIAGAGARLGPTAARVAATTSVAATAADGVAVTNQAVNLATNWDQMSNGDRAAGMLNLAFYGGMTALSLRAGGNNGMNFGRVANQFENGTPYPMKPNADLPDGAMRVTYDTGPNGRATNLRLEYGGSRDALDPQMVRLHSETARAMESSGSLSERLDNLLTRSGDPNPKPGTAAWEAQYEIGKIQDEIGQINQTMGDGKMSPYERASAEARLEELNTALEEQAARIPLSSQDGQGWVASPSTGAQQAEKLGWPQTPPEGYHWVGGQNNQPRLDRMPGNDGPQKTYDPATGGFIDRPNNATRGDLMPDDIDARNRQLSTWMTNNGITGLDGSNAGRVINQYRSNAQPPISDASGGVGTVAMVEVNGQTFVGVNSHNLNGGEGMALNRAIAQDAGIASNSFSNQTAFHAETHALLQAREANGGTMPEAVTIYSDRAPCGACVQNLGAVADQMGIKDLRIQTTDGRVWEMDPTTGRMVNQG